MCFKRGVFLSIQSRLLKSSTVSDSKASFSFLSDNWQFRFEYSFWDASFNMFWERWCDYMLNATELHACGGGTGTKDALVWHLYTFPIRHAYFWKCVVLTVNDSRTCQVRVSKDHPLSFPNISGFYINYIVHYRVRDPWRHGDPLSYSVSALLC